jgi:preprotein translocase subunit Sec61beta
MPPIKKSVLRLQNLRTKSSSDENRERERPKNLRRRDKNIISNIKKFFDSVKSCDLVIDPKKVVYNTAICAGVSEKTVINVMKERRESADGEASSPKKSRGRS